MGASPLFPPVHQNEEQAKEALLHVIRRDPRCLGLEQTRWTLESLLPHLSDFRLCGPSSLWHLFDRLGIHWLRGREHVHSPDPLYQPKRAFIEQVNERVGKSEGREILVYQDECSYDRQPSVASAYAPTRDPVRAERSHRSNTQTRIAGVLNAQTGAMQAVSGSKVGIKQLVELYRQVCDVYPGVQRIWVVQDNWPVHFHPDVLVALEPQECPFPFPRPGNWPDQPSPAACKRWGDWHLPVQLVVLPTYASWCNPIEKLWRMLKQNILHLHRQADDLQGLRQRVMAFLQQFALGSLSLLRYVGLLPT